MKIDSITKTFDEKTVFKDFSLDIRKGSRTRGIAEKNPQLSGAVIIRYTQSLTSLAY